MAQNSYDDLMNKLQESTDNQDSLNIKIAMKEEQNAKQELEIELYINDLEKTEKVSFMVRLATHSLVFVVALRKK